jgi:radical SAM protein with 4Fe4S-binding SPASM domain
VKLERPWSIQIELVEGCNKLCKFCALNSIRDRKGQDLRFMDATVGRQLAQQCSEFAPTARYEFAMHGEPLLHPELIEMLMMFRVALPVAQFQLTTNGKMFLKAGFHHKNTAQLMRIIDILLIDRYKDERDDINNFVALGAFNDYTVYDYYLDKNCPSPYNNHHRSKKFIVLMDDISENAGASKARVLYNQGGNSPLPPIEKPFEKTCTVPFRELSVRYNGGVNICCDDWTNQYNISNIKDMHLKDIWVHQKLELARKFLQNKSRYMNPCNACGIGSGSRVGFLPKYDEITLEEVVTMREYIMSIK